MVTIEAKIIRYLEVGDLWDVDLVQSLHNDKFSIFTQYSTVNAWFNRFESGNCIVLSSAILEPYEIELDAFYNEHGLDICSNEELASIGAVRKLEAAFDEIKCAPAVYETVVLLVKAIQVIRVSDPDFDTSFTHPEIPFSIFVSVGANLSKVCNLRLAESIIHEAMHLKLSLIEKYCPLINDNPQKFYYSPWRDDMRPASGILHGLYVFSAVKHFYLQILKFIDTEEDKDFVSFRIEEIEEDFKLLKDFRKASDLTASGRKLVVSLLQLEFD